MKTITIAALAIFVASFGQIVPVHGKILIEDVTETKVIRKTASSGMQLRKLRRVGVGMEAAGSLGLVGANLELNFNPRMGVLAGFGGGQGYQAFSFQLKKVLSGEWLLPYMSFGLARWYNTEKGEPIDKTGPGFLGNQFMSKNDKRKGQIDELLLFPAFGLQYMQLQGRWAGHSVYAQLMILIDIADFEAAPTGGVGYLYYF